MIESDEYVLLLVLNRINHLLTYYIRLVIVDYE